MPTAESGGRRSTPRTSRPAVARPSRGRRMGWRIAVLLALLCAPLAVRGGWLAATPDPIPAELIGTWETDEPRYADRAIEFQRAAVILHLGDAGAAGVHAVRRVARESTDAMIRYDIERWDGEVEDVLALRYFPGPRQIELTHPDGVRWHRRPPRARR